MWYSKKLSLFIKSLNFIAILASISVVNAADETTKLTEGLVQPKGLSIQVEHSDKFGFGQKEFLNTEQKLIEGRRLVLDEVALFSSDDRIGDVIRGLTHSKYSHIGFKLKDENDPQFYVCFESTGAASQILDMVFPQVQVAKWEDVVANYNGGVVTRKIIFEDKAPEWQDVTKFVNDNLGRSYEKNLLSLVKAINEENTEEDPSSVFCSELTALGFIQLRCLGTERLAANYVPGTFSSEQERKGKKPLPWINGVSLGNEVIIKSLPKRKASCCTIM